MDDPVTSPFYHAWTDRAEAERFQLHARELYNHYKDYSTACRTGHVEYGKWLIASLLAVHGGAIYAISSLRNSVKNDQLPVLLNAAAWNLGGILMILIAGFFAWLNFQCAEHTYNRWADPAMLYRSDCFPKDTDRADPISATLYLAAFFGLLSAYAFLVSSITIIQGLNIAGS